MYYSFSEQEDISAQQFITDTTHAKLYDMVFVYPSEKAVPGSIQGCVMVPWLLYTVHDILAMEG